MSVELLYNVGIFQTKAEYCYVMLCETQREKESGTKMASIPNVFIEFKAPISSFSRMAIGVIVAAAVFWLIYGQLFSKILCSLESSLHARGVPPPHLHQQDTAQGRIQGPASLVKVKKREVLGPNLPIFQNHSR